MLLEDENLYVSQNRAFSNEWQRELGNPVDQNVTVASIMMGYLNCRSSGKQCPADIPAYWKRDTGLIIERKRNRMEVDQSAQLRMLKTTPKMLMLVLTMKPTRPIWHY